MFSKRSRVTNRSKICLLVLSLTVVDNSTITPIGLTVPSDAPYDQEAFTFSHFKPRGWYDLLCVCVPVRVLPVLATWHIRSKRSVLIVMHSLASPHRLCQIFTKLPRLLNG